MDSFIVMALIATLGTWLVTALGAATVVFFTSPRVKVLNLMLGFSAGVMIAASFWSLLEPAIARAELLPGPPAWFVATMGFLTGALFLWASDKLVSRSLGRVESGGVRRIILLVLSITIHNIPEGLAVGVAFGALQQGCSTESLMGAVSVAVGIGLQNFPEGAAVSVPLRREGWSVRKADNRVLDGIRVTADLLKSGRIVLCRECGDCLREMEQYCWDERGGRDAPRKENDHAMDDLRYFAMDLAGEGHGGFAATCVERRI